MELRQLLYFQAVAEARNFTRAAEMTHVTQPSLSRQIQLLEEEVGLKLFHRHKGGVHLTEAGERFLEHSRRILDELNRVQASLRDLQALRTGHIRIAAPAALAGYLLPGVLVRFGREYPGIRVSALHAEPDEVERAVYDGRADFGLTYLPVTQEGLDVEPLCAESLLAAFPAAGADSPFAAPEADDLRELASLPLVTLSPPNAIRAAVDRAFTACGAVARVHMEMTDLHAVARLVAAGLGYSLLPERFLAGAGAGFALRARRLAHPGLQLEIGVVHRRGRYRCHGSRALLDMLRCDVRAPRPAGSMTESLSESVLESVTGP